MVTRRRAADIGTARGRALRTSAVHELAEARRNAGVSQLAAAVAAGMSRTRYGRIERGEDEDVSIDELARMGAALGQELAVRFYPAGDPVRDDGHRAVLERLRRVCHPSLRFATEVPLPAPGDRRAWDALISGFQPRLRCGAEAETHPTDEQALGRKLALKRRDGAVDRLLLVLPDTRHNRAFLRGSTGGFRAGFPVRGSRAIELLRAGADPGGDAILLL